MVLEEGDRLLRFRRVQIQIRSGFQAIDPTHVFGERRVHDVVDVLNVVDLVLTGFDDLVCVQTFRHMASDGHAKPVRLVGNGLYLCEFDRAVDLHLLKTGSVIAIDPLSGLFWSVDTLYAQCHRATAIYDAGKQQTRAEAAILRYGIADRSDEFEFVATVSDRGYTRGQVDWPPLALFEMSMHVP